MVLTFVIKSGVSLFPLPKDRSFEDQRHSVDVSHEELGSISQDVTAQSPPQGIADSLGHSMLQLVLFPCHQTFVS